MVKRSAALSFVFALSILSIAATAQQRSSAQPAAPPQDEPGSRQSAHAEVATAAEEKNSQTTHVVRLDGREIKYTATTGTLPIRLEEGRVAARMFFVAYTKDGEDVKTRPIAFLYNGGPGAATIWLHMGSFAPRRVQMADEGFQPAPPYHFADNENSLIDVTDLVFIDAIDTGYSRVVAGVDNRQFHGQTGDIRAFGEVINEYLKAYNRWPSPKFLIGESYKVFVACGYYDMATPFAGSEFNFSHLAYDKPVIDRVSFGYYEAGHMIYTRPSAHKALKSDISRFIRSSSGTQRPASTSQP